MNEALNQQSEVAINEINQNLDKFSGQADVREFSKDWELLKMEQTGGELDYAIFGNGKTENGYRNIVVSFEGTKSSDILDYLTDGALALGFAPPQVHELNGVAQAVAEFNPDKVYATGHSLGGYLAQYFAAHTMQTNKE